MAVSRFLIHPRLGDIQNAMEDISRAMLVSRSELDEANFYIDYLYEALGAAGDEVMEMASEAWKVERAKS